jgi:hypothetical protein
MAGPAFRMYFGTRPATAEELARVEEVVVEQEVDMAWEARVRLSMCTDATGRWRHGSDGFAPPFTRVRVEVRVADGPFVPLIDGPVAGSDTALDARPGRSGVTLIVRDDSVLMNRAEGTEVFEGKADDAIARELFARFPQIDSTRIRATTGTPPAAVRRGTPIQFLRELARANGFRAYVLPGPLPGKSVGCFLPDPTGPGALPPLTLLGDKRNLLDLTLTEDAEGPERTTGRTLTISDQQVVSSEGRGRDLGLMRNLPTVPDDLAALRQLPPADNDRDDPTARTAAQTRRAAGALKVSARVRPGCYPAALSPYQKVTLKAGDLPRVSGDYLLTRVTHRLGPSAYTQEFEGTTDSQSAPAAGGGLTPPAIF